MNDEHTTTLAAAAARTREVGVHALTQHSLIQMDVCRASQLSPQSTWGASEDEHCVGVPRAHARTSRAWLGTAAYSEAPLAGAATHT